MDLPSVLFVSPTSAPGGAEIALAHLNKALVRRGWETAAVLSRRGPLVGWLKESGARVHCLNLSGRSRVLDSLETVLAIRRIALRQRTNVVVSNHSLGHILGGTAATLSGLPAIGWQHQIPPGTFRDRLAARIPADAWVVGGTHAHEGQRALGGRYAISVIPLGLPIQEIQQRIGSGSAVRQKLGWSEEFIVGTVGRLQRDKGQQTFLDAAELIAAQAPECKFLIVGGAILGWEGSYPEELSRRVQSSDILRDRVVLVGHQEDVYPWIDACDVLVSASQTESFGLAVLESLALGRPTVSTSSGGPTEILGGGTCGILVPTDDVDALAEAVCTIYHRPALAQALSKAAMARAEDFDVARMVDQWEHLLRRIAYCA